MVKIKAIILAGGSGERFWPLSNSKTPKQFLKIFSNKSLIRETYERLVLKLDPKDIFVITAEKHFDLTKKELPELPEENIILEPIPRNTAPACTLATLVADKNEVVFILPADHYIPDVENFWKTIFKAVNAAKEYDGLFTLGIKPTRPETGYGYIESKNEVEENIFKVKAFREKPNVETAIDFIKKGNFYWNSGMFIWKKDVFFEEMEKYNSNIIKKLKDVDPRNIEKLRKIMPEVEKISIDYALMEKSKKVYTIKSNFSWSDVGNWLSVRELKGYSDENENVKVVEGKNIYVSSKKFVGVIGLSNIVVVETDNGILVANEEKVQKVREIVSELKEKGKF
ncbi:mannose-1-phosphate guanylyltransferase [Tepiditoga spiralis]|uniref:mannose-1-phosphate guanylyltransferase n=1 Tax=Tepiditoga spiralis TaxID=2108365 RepID=A0A7G1GAJ6_9BACT|nr:mannose-1-phosphate guanylyltransferase [Tepiditoga spiralis]BBE30509.1 mannose-1-phosphate guanylyltransferase [Tepiditoga spiralis]